MTQPRAERTRIPVPAFSRRAHLLAAGVLWSTVGLGLLGLGASWLLRAPTRWTLQGGVLALCAGWLKSRLVLRRTARRIVRRIEERGDGRCLGGFLSWKSWLLVLGMMLAGWILRHSGLSLYWRGLIYCAIGSALFLSSLTIWTYRARRDVPGGRRV